MRSEVEALRWVLVRRAVIGIIFMAALSLSMLRYITYRNNERHKAEREMQRREADEAAAKRKQEQDNIGRVDAAAAPEAAVVLTAA